MVILNYVNVYIYIYIYIYIYTKRSLSCHSLTAIIVHEHMFVWNTADVHTNMCSLVFMSEVHKFF